jgi:putative tryptophan/tyrosine transport system substrate-binding protein
MAVRRSTRRDALAAGAAIAALFPVLAFAQSVKVWRLGFLSARSRDSAIEVPPFVEGMRELGYVEGKNIRYEWRFADGKYERLRALADELVALKVDVIAASGTPTVQAAQQATREIPIVMVAVVDPVRLGFVASLARPGGNITGVSNMNEEVWRKQFDLLVETLPGLTRVAVLVNPGEQFSEAAFRSVEAAARRHNTNIVRVGARSAAEIDRAFVTMKQERAQALVVVGGAFFVQQRSQLTDLASKARLPAVYYRREYVEAGGLMSYGRNAAIGYRRAATYVDKVFKGASPADLPVEQPTVIEVVVNRKAAKELGITFPPQVLVQADKIIE